MRVLLKFDLDADVDTAWDAIRDPRAMAAAAAPLLTITSTAPGGFPARWREGDHPVAVRAIGVLPLGTQVIGIRLPVRGDDVRMLRDVGPTTGGLLSLVTRWEHTLAVSPLPDGRTRYRDRLRFEAGVLTPLLWPVFWAVWQWRGARLQRLVRERAARAR